MSGKTQKREFEDPRSREMESKRLKLDNDSQQAIQALMVEVDSKTQELTGKEETIRRAEQEKEQLRLDLQKKDDKVQSLLTDIQRLEHVNIIQNRQLHYLQATRLPPEELPTSVEVSLDRSPHDFTQAPVEAADETDEEPTPATQLTDSNSDSE